MRTSAAITVIVIVAECSQITSMLMPTNSMAVMIMGNRQCDHEFVIIAPVYSNRPDVQTHAKNIYKYIHRK